MRKSLLLWGAALGFAASMSSCVTDPYYTSGGAYYGSGYSNYGYGDGYGYGNPGFSTSIFVSTGNPRWGYDPYCYSYYDYHRRCYYDPYLYGYYPVGYRPPVIVGCPHPYGWRPGSGHCPPPSRIRDVTVVNYRNRESSYRNLNHSWSRNVRADYGNHSSRGGFSGRSFDRGSSGTYNPQGPSPYRFDGPPSGNSQHGGFKSWKGKNERDGFRPNDGGASLPPGFNQPVATPPSQRTKDGGFRTRLPDGGTQGQTLRGLGQSGPDMETRSHKNSGFGFDRGGGSHRKIDQPRDFSPSPERQSAPRIERNPSNKNHSDSDGDHGSGRHGGFR